jgi:archaellum component FlaC
MKKAKTTARKITKQPTRHKRTARPVADERINGIGERLDKIEGRLDKVDNRLDKIEKQLHRVAKDITEMKDVAALGSKILAAVDSPKKAGEVGIQAILRKLPRSAAQ